MVEYSTTKEFLKDFDPKHFFQNRQKKRVETHSNDKPSPVTVIVFHALSEFTIRLDISCTKKIVEVFDFQSSDA